MRYNFPGISSHLRVGLSGKGAAVSPLLPTPTADGSWVQRSVKGTWKGHQPHPQWAGTLGAAHQAMVKKGQKLLPRLVSPNQSHQSEEQQDSVTPPSAPPWLPSENVFAPAVIPLLVLGLEMEPGYLFHLIQHF